MLLVAGGAAGVAIGSTVVGCSTVRDGASGASCDADGLHEHAAAIAAAARREHPELESGSVADELGLSAAALADPATIDVAARERVGRAMSEDFALGATLGLAGWLLATTEVRLAMAIDEAVRAA